MCVEFVSMKIHVEYAKNQTTQGVCLSLRLFQINHAFIHEGHFELTSAERSQSASGRICVNEMCGIESAQKMTFQSAIAFVYQRGRHYATLHPVALKTQ